MSSEVHIRKGLIKYYEGIIGLAEANVKIYFENSVGIGEHSDIVQAVDAEVEKLADAQDKLKSVKELLHPTKKTLVE